MGMKAREEETNDGRAEKENRVQRWRNSFHSPSSIPQPKAETGRTRRGDAVGQSIIEILRVRPCQPPPHHREEVAYSQEVECFVTGS